MKGIKLVLMEILGRKACAIRGVDADELSVTTGLFAWQFMAIHEITQLQKERTAIQRLEHTA